MLGIEFLYVRRKPFRCSGFKRKLACPWNRSQDKYNQDWYKSENQYCLHWLILGSYQNSQIMHCIESRNQHKSTETGISFYVKHNAIRDIVLNIGKDISDNYYGEISTIDKMYQMYIILLNGQLVVILCGLIIRWEEVLSSLVSWCVMQYIWIYLLISGNGVLFVE